MSKATDAQVEKRIEVVTDILMRGGTRADVLQYCASEWDIRTRQADNYLKRAWEYIRDTAERDKERHINLAIQRYQDLYKRSFKVQDYRECRQINAEMIKLLGLAEPEKVEHSGGINIQPVEWVKSEDQ